MFTYIYPCLLMFNYSYSGLPMFATVYSCMFAYVYSLLLVFPMFTLVYLFSHIYSC